MTRTANIQAKRGAVARHKSLRKPRSRAGAPTPRRHPSRADAGRAPRGARPVGEAASRVRLRYAKLRVHKIECIKSTKEADRDEIRVTAIKTLGKVETKNRQKTLSAKSSRGKTIDAGKFKKGTEVCFKKPRTIASFPLGDPDLDWPRYFLARVVLIEKDKGGAEGVVDAMIDAIDDDVAKKVASVASTVAVGAMASALGAGAAAGSVVPLVGTAIGAGVAAAVMGASTALRGARKDDCFPARKLQLKLAGKPRAAGQVSGSRKTLTFKAHGGEYKVTSDWAVEEE